MLFTKEGHAFGLKSLRYQGLEQILSHHIVWLNCRKEKLKKPEVKKRKKKKHRLTILSLSQRSVLKRTRPVPKVHA